jgi:hypothetical protein
MFAVRFLPESPRWLMANGHDQEALDFLVRYHGGGRKGDPVVRLEWWVFAPSGWFRRLNLSTGRNSKPTYDTMRQTKDGGTMQVVSSMSVYSR